MSMDNNLMNLMKEAQKMQERMQEAQKSLADAVVTGSAGGVETEMNGRHDILRVKIAPALMQGPVEVLEGYVAAAMNDAARKVEKASKDVINQMTAGMNIPKDFLKGGE